MNILHSTILSNMSYTEGSYLYSLAMSVNDLIDDRDINNFINENKLNIENSILLEKSIDLFFKTHFDDDKIKHIIDKRNEFYHEFKEDLNIHYLNSVQLLEIAKKDSVNHIKKQIANVLNRTSNLKKIDLPIFLERFSTIFESTYISQSSENKKELLEDTYNFYQKFSHLEFSESLQEKFKIFNPKNDHDIEVDFDYGYINAGRKGIDKKDGSLLIGYTRENDENILYVSFRGTEKRAKHPLKYFLENYPNMERQYNHFEPILQDIIQEEIKKHKDNNPNTPLKVVFTGHSLGAALAEKALDNFKDTESVSYKGVFIANPGSLHYLQKKINKFDEISNKQILYRQKNYNKFLSIGSYAISTCLLSAKITALITVGVFNYITEVLNSIYKPSFKVPNPVEKVVQMSSFGMGKFLNIGYSVVLYNINKTLLNSLSFLKIIDKKESDPRGITINHQRDNIPQIGKILFQNDKSQTLNLSDIIPEVENTLNPYKKIIHFHYHSTENYYKEIKNKHNEIENILKMRKNIKPDGRLMI